MKGIRVWQMWYIYVGHPWDTYGQKLLFTPLRHFTSFQERNCFSPVSHLFCFSGNIWYLRVCCICQIDIWQHKEEIIWWMTNIILIFTHITTYITFVLEWHAALLPTLLLRCSKHISHTLSNQLEYVKYHTCQKAQ